MAAQDSPSPHETKMQSWIEAAFHFLQQGPDETEVIARLVAMGCPLITAEKLVCFLPLACGRILLADSGVRFSPAFRCISEDGQVGESQSLAADSDWVTTQAWVAAQRRAQPEAIAYVGMQSAEFDAVNQALLKGSKASDLVGSEPIFRLTDLKAEPQRRKSPWWTFGR